MRYLLPPKNCPHCGRLVEPAAGLYRCETCGSFEPALVKPVNDGSSQPMRDRFAAEEAVPSLPIDGRAVALDKRFRR